jgi:peptide/nickel transport system substrate-binding protein
MHSLRQSIVRQLRDAADRGQVASYEHIGNNAGGAILNTKQAPLDDVRVRRSLAYALNQDQLIDVLGGAGISPPQTQYFSKDSPWYSPDVAKMWPTNDAAKAKKLLAEYVNDPKRSDGKAVGTPVSFDFNCPPDASLIELSQAYQQFWNDVGFQVNLNQVEQAAHIQNAITDNYTANCWRMGGEGDPYSTLAVSFGDPATQPLNFTNFGDSTVGEQLDVLKSTVELSDRKAAVERIMMRLAEEVPLTWTGSTATAVGARPELHNVGGWQFPDGTRGNGVSQGVTFLGWVWLEK